MLTFQQDSSSGAEAVQKSTDGAAHSLITVGEAHVGEVGGKTSIAVQSFTRPAGTLTYASGQLIANSATATAVAAMALTVGRLSSGSGASGMIRRLRLRKTGTSLTGASFRLHFWRTNINLQATVTMTSANPGVVTWTGHGLSTGSAVQFTTTGGLPTNVVAGTTYYVIVIGANTFYLATTSANAYAGTKIDTTAGAQSGVNTGYQCTPVGDGGVFVPNHALNYVGKVDITCDQAFNDGASGNGVPAVGSEINFAVQTYYVLIEARGAYPSIANEVFTIESEDLQN